MGGATQKNEKKRSLFSATNFSVILTVKEIYKVRTIPFGRPMIGDEEKDAVMDVLNNPILVHGPKSQAFEKEFAAYTGAPYAVSVSSCTAAMHLVYFDLGLGPGDEVVVPAQTHTATAHAVELCGAKAVFVDAEISTGNIDTNALEQAITDRTRAVAVVHYLGMPVDMDRVNETARKHGLFVIEDCALAIGTQYKNKHAGLLGNAGCFSFYPVKHMTTAEGGMIITGDADMAQRLARKKAFGVDRHMGERKIPGVYDVNMLGLNYRMNEIQAAIGIEQVKKMDRFLEKRAAHYGRLHGALKEMDEIALFESSDGGDFKSSHYCMSVLLKPDLAPRRFEFVEALKSKNVGTSVYYPKPVPLMQYYRDKYGYEENDFPVASRISYTSVALPVGPHLDDEDVTYMIQSVKEAILEVK